MQKLPTVRPALSDLTFSTGTDTGKKNIWPGTTMRCRWFVR
jgi:hypothetical protein